MKKTYIKPVVSVSDIRFEDSLMWVSFGPGDGSGGTIQVGGSGGTSSTSGGILGEGEGGLVIGTWPGLMNRDEW